MRRTSWFWYSRPYSQPFSLGFIVLAVAWALLSGYSIKTIGETILSIAVGMLMVHALIGFIAGAFWALVKILNFFSPPPPHS